MGITGTTAKEAEETISGSLVSLKASWQNLIVGITNPDADLKVLIQQLVDSVIIAGKNILPAVEQALIGVSTLLSELLPIIAQKIPDILNQILPQLITTGVNSVQSLITGIQQNLPALISGAMQIITTLVNGILDMLPEILNMGIEIILQLIIGISQQLPELIPKMIDCVLLIVETLIDNIDLLVDAGIELILGLAEGLIEAIPRLIEKAPIIIQKLLDALIRNFPKIVKAGGELLGKLVSGIVGSIFKLLEVAPQLISTIVNGLKNGLNEIKNVGKYLIEGLWKGISGMANWVADKVKSFAKNILTNMKKALGIHSPSRVFRDEVGKFIPQGIAVGIEADTDSALKAIDNMNDDIMSKMNRTVALETGSINAKASVKSNNSIMNIINANLKTGIQSIDNNKEIVVNSVTNLDSKVLTSAVNRVNARQKLQYGLA